MMNTQKTALFTILLGVAVSIVAGCSQESILADCEEYPPGIATTLIGRTKQNMLYELGSVLVLYEDQIKERRASSENLIPIPSVNNFFVKKGHTPRVFGTISSTSFEIIYVGKGVNVMPMLKDLRRVSGVVAAELLPLFRVSGAILSSGPDPEGGVKRSGGKSVRPALIEVGKTIDGLLYDLGSIVVRYHKRIRVLPGAGISADHASSEAVSNFFIERGYSPEKRLVHPYVEVIHINKCADLIPLLKDLRMTPMVADAQLDVIHTILAEEPKILEDIRDLE